MDSFLQFISSLNDTETVFVSESHSLFKLNNEVQLYFLPLGSLKKINIEEDVVVVHEDVWRSKTDVVKSRIKSILGINDRTFARKTNVQLISKSDCLDFYNKYHINMPLVGMYNYGLLFEDELIGAISFGRPCPIHRGGRFYKKSYVLLRFCTKTNINIVGGLSKLIQHFIKDKKPDDIMTHIDLEWSNGGGFKKLGFKEIGQTADHILYLDPKTHHRYNENYIPSELNKEEMLPVYNHGSLKLALELNGVSTENS